MIQWLLKLIDSFMAKKYPPAPIVEEHGDPTDGGTVIVLPEPPKPFVQESSRWDTPKAAWHSVRVLCDEMGLTLEQKNILCACVYQESRFDNRAVGKNKWSTDWGLIQVNDTPGWHIGPGLQFPSVQYVLDNPEKPTKWMISVMKKTGALQPWASYTSGAYRQWLIPTSPMWALKG